MQPLPLPIEIMRKMVDAINAKAAREEINCNGKMIPKYGEQHRYIYSIIGFQFFLIFYVLSTTVMRIFAGGVYTNSGLRCST